MNAGSTPTPARTATKCRRAKPYIQRTGETNVDWCDFLMSTSVLPFCFLEGFIPPEQTWDPTEVGAWAADAVSFRPRG